jgi:hypothetical protein
MTALPAQIAHRFAKMSTDGVLYKVGEPSRPRRLEACKADPGQQQDYVAVTNPYLVQ